MPTNRLYNFDSGLYGVNSLSSRNIQELKNIFDNIQNTLQQNPKTKYQIIIRGGESLVTNPPGFERKGSLADARSNTIRSYLTINYPSINTNTNVSIRIASPIIGIEPYDRIKGDNKDDAKYKKEQFVEILFQPYIPPNNPNPCAVRYGNSSTKVATTIPPDGKVWTIAAQPFPNDFSEGIFEMFIVTFSYPDAIEVEFLDIDRNITKTGFIPLFQSTNPSDSMFKDNLNDLYKFYKKNPTAKTFDYLPLLRANNKADMNKQLKATYPGYSSLFNQDFPSSEDNGFYDIIPVLSPAEINKAIIPPELPTPIIEEILYESVVKPGNPPVLKKSRQFERKIFLPKTPDDVYVRINIYGYRKDTQFDYQVRCKSNAEFNFGR